MVPQSVLLFIARERKVFCDLAITRCGNRKNGLTLMPPISFRRLCVFSGLGGCLIGRGNECVCMMIVYTIYKYIFIYVYIYTHCIYEYSYMHIWKDGRMHGCIAAWMDWGCGAGARRAALRIFCLFR